MDKTARKQKALAGVEKLKAQPSGSDKFEGSSEEAAPDSKTKTPAWKRFA